MRIERPSIFLRAMLCAIAISCGVAQAAPEIRYTANANFTEKLAPKDDPSLIEVRETASPRAQVTIGRLAIRGDPGSSHDQLVSLAKRKAAELGADFVRIIDEGDTTTRTFGPSGAVGFGGLQPRGSSRTLMTARYLSAVVGVFAKATLGLEYVDFHVTWGRPVVKGFRPHSQASAAGVKVGDEIVEIDGIRAIGDEPRFYRWLLNMEPEHVARVVLKRGDSNLIAEVPLMAND